MTAKITFGMDANHLKVGQSHPVVWDETQVVNPHILIVGMSGAGKTHNLRRMIKQLKESAGMDIRIHVFDVHGDIDIPGASTLMFSEQTQYGLNPLVVNPDPDFGGVRKRIQSFIGILSRTRALGAKQENVIRNLLTDLYRSCGFEVNDPATWSRGVSPTVQDLLSYARQIQKQVFLGSNQKSVAALESFEKAARGHHKKMVEQLKKGADAEDAESVQDALEKAGLKAIEVYSEFIASVKTGDELDSYMRYDSAEVLKSVVDRLDNLNSVGIFRSKTPPFCLDNPVWRYQLKALSAEERKLFVHFRLEEMFLAGVQRGEQKRLRDVFVLDEAHAFCDDDPDNIVSTIAKEARKFGQSLIAASQAPNHFTEDFLTSVGTKFVLAIDESYWDGAARKLRLDGKALEWIKPRQTCAVQIKAHTENKNVWKWVVLPKLHASM